jgi:hypothetical protein
LTARLHAAGIVAHGANTRRTASVTTRRYSDPARGRSVLAVRDPLAAVGVAEDLGRALVGLTLRFELGARAGRPPVPG